MVCESLNLPSSAADGFRASERPPRSKTKTCAAGDASRRASLARSSSMFSKMKVSTRVARSSGSTCSVPPPPEKGDAEALFCVCAIATECTRVASRKRPVSAEEGLRASVRPPLSRIAACTCTGACRSASLADSSTWFSRMKVSTSMATSSGERTFACAA